MEDRCVCCGEIIPEGRMVCPMCEDDFFDNYNYCNECRLYGVNEHYDEEKNEIISYCDACTYNEVR